MSKNGNKIYLDLETTFFVTAHGPFKVKLEELGLEDEDRCERGEIITSEYVLWDCMHYNELRQQTLEEFKNNRDRNSKLLTTERGWKGLQNFSKGWIDSRNSTPPRGRDGNLQLQG